MEQLYEQVEATRKQYGGCLASWDFARFIVESSLSVKAGNRLYKLLRKHNINGGMGLAIDSMRKLNHMLDGNVVLPFQESTLTTETWKGKWTLYHRNVLDVIQYYFGLQQFDKHIHVRPVAPTDIDGSRVYKDFFTGEMVHEMYKHIPDGHIVLLIILYSDKTHTDVLGIHEAYPVYLYLGNIETAVRCKDNNAGIVIGVSIVGCVCTIGSVRAYNGTAA